MQEKNIKQRIYSNPLRRVGVTFGKAVFVFGLLAISLVVGACDTPCVSCPPPVIEYLRFTADGKRLSMGSITATDTLVNTPPTIQELPGVGYWTLGVGIDGLAFIVTLSFPQQLGALPVTLPVNWDTTSTSTDALAFAGWVEPNVRGYFADKVSGSITITEVTDHIKGTFELHEIGHVGQDETTIERKDVAFDVTNGEFNLKIEAL